MAGHFIWHSGVDKDRTIFTQKSTSDSEAADEVCVFDEESQSLKCTAEGWLEAEVRTTQICEH